MNSICKLLTALGIVMAAIATVGAVIAFFTSEEKKKKDLADLKRYLNGVIE